MFHKHFGIAPTVLLCCTPYPNPILIRSQMLTNRICQIIHSKLDQFETKWPGFFFTSFHFFLRLCSTYPSLPWDWPHPSSPYKYLYVYKWMGEAEKEQRNGKKRQPQNVLIHHGVQLLKMSALIGSINSLSTVHSKSGAMKVVRYYLFTGNYFGKRDVFLTSPWHKLRTALESPGSRWTWPR